MFVAFGATEQESRHECTKASVTGHFGSTSYGGSCDRPWRAQFAVALEDLLGSIWVPVTRHKRVGSSKGVKKVSGSDPGTEAPREKWPGVP